MGKKERKPIVLLKKDAIAKWQEGKEVWNKWVKENPEAGVIFSGVDFSEYEENSIDFNGFKFPNGTVSFEKACFGEGSVSFREADFGLGVTTFENAKFGNGNVTFSKAKLRGIFTMSGTIFGEGNVSFSFARFQGIKFLFEKVHFNGHADFSYIKGSSNVEELSFKQSTFEKTLDLSGSKFNCLVDLTSTKITHHVSLERLHIQFDRRSGKGEHYLDIGRLRRLKEIAENNKNHTLALILHADEMRAVRWTEPKFKPGQILDLCFDWFSLYGQSIGRPVLSLIITTLVFGVVYISSSIEVGERTLSNIYDGLILSASQAIPFVPIINDVRSQGIEQMFGGTGNISTFLYMLMSIQGLISFIFLFLIGLGLRNRFRL